MQLNWTGIYPALTTKFNPDGSLDFSLFEKNLAAQMDAGVNGIILGGTLGEASVLSTEEKEILVKLAIKKTAGKIPVILNVAEGSTRDAIWQVSLAKRWEAHGVMLLPPMRYKPDERELTQYFTDIAASTDLPIMIYNNPVDYNTEVTLEVFEALLPCRNIEAVKESTRDITNITRMKNRFGDRYKILCGVDTLAFESLCAGADGWVAGLVCAFPNETVAIYKLVQQGRYAEALSIYRWFMPLLELDIHPKLVQYIKMAEAAVGLGAEHVRPPRLSIIGKERSLVEKTINDALKTRPEIPATLE